MGFGCSDGKLMALILVSFACIVGIWCCLFVYLVLPPFAAVQLAFYLTPAWMDRHLCIIIVSF
jgi:hypothetical protein